ncbi:hypothetical protein ACVDG5_007740 [Mesorhizobium sp. ORM6]
MVKIIFFHAASWPQTSMAAGRNLPSDNIVMERQGGGRARPRGCAVVPAGIMPRGFFATLPTNRGRSAEKEGKQTQPVSFVEKAGFVPGPSAYGLHMAEFARKCKGSMLQRSKNDRKATLALLGRHHYHKTQLSFFGDQER